MNYKTGTLTLLSLFIFLFFHACSWENKEEIARAKFVEDSIQAAKLEQIRLDSIQAVYESFRPENIIIEKELLYDNHTLGDTYPYKDTTREFQWEKIRVFLGMFDSLQNEPVQWGILKNRKNFNGEAPLVKHVVEDAYGNMADTFGVERYQSIPLFSLHDTTIPERYAFDGSLIKIIDDKGDSMDMVSIWSTTNNEEWKVPRKYIKYISDTVIFEKIIFVDRHNQNLTTLEKKDKKWLIRSMNPATTGVYRPPYMQETPLGVFVVQEKKVKMFYFKDGTEEIDGFAPHASRFCNGAYLHGIPVKLPNITPIEYSFRLGTKPLSHMCVRNATSHSEFVFNWAPVEESLVIILE